VGFYSAALSILDRFRDEDVVRPMRTATLGRLGAHLARSGDYRRAESLLREALSEVQALAPDDPVAHGSAWNDLGVCLRFAARFDEAEAAYAEAEACFARAGRPAPATLLHNLAGLACARGEPAVAERWARHAVEQRRSDGDDFLLGTDLCGLGDALAGLGRPDEAEAAYRDGLARYTASGRADHPEVAWALHGLADALADRKRSDEAEATYRACLELKLRLYGLEHLETAATLSNLATLLAGMGRLAEASELSAQARAVARAVLPTDHPVRQGIDALGRDLGARADPAD
jgi:tetratricopeptide (TPR) repeat protein